MLSLSILSFLSPYFFRELTQTCPHRLLSSFSYRRQHDVFSLNMGLYDDLNEQDEGKDDDYEEILFLPPLFSFKPDGTETNNLLPKLRRRIDTGISCYYEPSDEKVIQLIQMTGCNADDACWAMEAHGGNIMSARQDIYYASRLALSKKVDLQVPTQEEIENTDWDEELFQLLSQKEQTNKDGGVLREQDEIIRPVGMDGNEKLKRQKKNQSNQGMNGKPNADWLPGFKPGPNDDEPWFTG